MFPLEFFDLQIREDQLAGTVAEDRQNRRLIGAGTPFSR
jgi:hypothetical protein